MRTLGVPPERTRRAAALVPALAFALAASAACSKTAGPTGLDVPRKQIRLVMHPARSIDCTFQIQAATAPGDRISGMWASTSCTATYGGTIELTRE
jgi:hypothetical protein